MFEMDTFAHVTAIVAFKSCEASSCTQKTALVLKIFVTDSLLLFLGKFFLSTIRINPFINLEIAFKDRLSKYPRLTHF